MTLETGHLAPYVFGVTFVLLLALERWRPLRRRSRAFGPRFALNVALTVLVFATGALAVRPAAMFVAGRVMSWPLGLLPVFALPQWAEIAVAFLLMDLTFYYWHRANHVFSILWRFHNVHHMDPDLDVSTSFRFHPAEVLYSTCFRVAQVAILGVRPGTYVLYEIAFQCATMFHHSNLRLPIRIERWLNRIVVTPRMHGIHHSIMKNETNSNYSVVFRWWDWLHRSLRLNIRQDEITIGIPAYLRPEDNSLLHCLALPFLRQRDYGLAPDNSRPIREPSPGASDVTAMAE